MTNSLTVFKYATTITFVTILSVFITACSESDDIPWYVNDETQRWYSKEQVSIGRAVFKQNCATCHGAKAQGAFNWQRPDAAGNYPPPPLNGSAHSWHHPYPALFKVVSEGGKVMPAWGGKLSEEEITASIAFFQNYWPDQAYQLWLKRHKR